MYRHWPLHWDAKVWVLESHKVSGHFARKRVQGVWAEDGQQPSHWPGDIACFSITDSWFQKGENLSYWHQSSTYLASRTCSGILLKDSIESCSRGFVLDEMIGKCSLYVTLILHFILFLLFGSKVKEFSFWTVQDCEFDSFSTCAATARDFDLELESRYLIKSEMFMRSSHCILTHLNNCVLDSQKQISCFLIRGD